MKAKNNTDYNIFVNERVYNEMKCLSDSKSELYDLVYLHDDGNRDEELIKQGKEYVEKINKCLMSLIELCDFSIETDNKINKTDKIKTAIHYVSNFKKGYYDKLHGELCAFTGCNIMKGK